MDVKSYLAILMGKKWVILATIFIAVAATALVTYMITPVYTASTTLRIAAAASGVTDYADYVYADRLLNTYTKIAASGPVLKELTQTLKLTSQPQVTVEAVPNTELIKISVESSNPAVAQQSANTLADIMIKQGKALYTGGGKSAQDILGEQVKQAEDELNQARQDYNQFVAQSPKDTATIESMAASIQLKERTYATLLDQYDQARLRESLRSSIISVVEPANLPSSPTSPNRLMNILLGLAAGAVGGLGLAFFLESFGARLYSSKQIEETAELTPLAKIPHAQQKGLLSVSKHSDENNNGSTFKEAFRQLQVNLSMISADRLNGNGFKTLLVTSAEPGEGKTTVAANLAIAAAQTGKKVIVVDCDLHIPKIHKIISGLSNTVGLTSVLNQESDLEGAVQFTHYPGMHVITSGPQVRNPVKLLAAPQMKAMLAALAQNYDMVILDTPALLAVADTALLTCAADAVIFVARRNFIREDAVREACRKLNDIKARVVGLVVNEAESNGSHYYYRR